MSSTSVNTSVKDVGSIMNYVGNRGASATSGAEEVKSGFDAAMHQAFGKTAAKNAVKQPIESGSRNVKKDSADQPSAHHAAKNDAAEKKAAAEAKSAAEKSPPEGEAVRDTGSSTVGNNATEAQDAGKEIVKAIADELGLSEEEILAAMETMGLTVISLLDPANMTDLVLQLSGADTFDLVTNEALYSTVTELSQISTRITEGFLQNSGISDADLKALIAEAEAAANIAAQADEAHQEELSGNLTEKGLPANADPANPGSENYRKEITIVMEKNGEIREITATTDAKGNVEATKDVVTTTVESKTTAEGESKDGSNNGEKSGEQANQHGLKDNPWLDNLLQNKPQAVEATAEAASVFEVPDTEHIMRQIMDYMKINLKTDMNQLEMQLHPANLGTLNIRITAKEGVITAQFTAQNEAVKAIIESQMAVLKENLNTQGIKVEAVEVSVSSQAFDSQLWQGQEQEKSFEGNKKSPRRINLNDLDLEQLPEDMNEEDRLTTEMLLMSGGTVDYTA